MSSSVISMRKYFKRNKVLNIIRSGQNVSRYDVKKETLYSIASVAEIIGELIADGLVYEEECQEARVGRKPTWLRLNPGGAYFIGVEFNAQMMYCAMLNLVGDVVWQSSEPVSKNDSGDEITAQIIRMVNNAIGHAPNGKLHIFGICVGVPGYCDKEKGIGISYTHLKNWENVPLKQPLEEAFGLPCYIDSNVDMMALAYKWFYFKGDVRDYVFISMRTGIHMVPFINNELILSKSGFPGELGHVRLAGGGGRICSCGRYGCLNSEISNIGILNVIREGVQVGRFKQLLALAQNNTENITIDLFCESVLAGHADSVVLMKRTAGLLGEALGTVVNLLAPRVIVLSGSLPSLGDLFISEVYAAMEPFTVSENYNHLEVCTSAFDKNIGAIGAAAMVMQEEFEFIDKPV